MNGMVHAVRIIMHRMEISHGFLDTMRPQPFSLPVAFFRPDHFRSHLFSFAGLIRSPTAAKIAGTKMIAINTATNTLTAAASPIIVINGICTTDKPTNAIMTVRPANTTELPAVALA
ncbi:hypothetical protein D3C72_1064050 [compost metagenome]